MTKRRGNRIRRRHGTSESAYVEVWTARGEAIKVSPADLARVRAYTWHTRQNGRRRIAEAYVATDATGKERTITMTRLLYDPPAGMVARHENGDPLDYRRENVALVPMREAQYTSGPRRTNRSGYKGVTFDPATHRYVTRVWADGRSHHVGRFVAAGEAAAAYNARARELQGPRAFLNPHGEDRAPAGDAP